MPITVKQLEKIQNKYDIVFITHLPAFYKVNLYQAIAKHCRVLVIFVGPSSSIRQMDFTAALTGIDHVVLGTNNFEQQGFFKQIRMLYTLRQWLQSIQYQQLVVGGWDLLVFWAAVWLSPKNRNALALESSYFESNVNGWRKWIKQCFLSRISTALCSGKPHHQLLAALQFKGTIKTTLGVGIFHYGSSNFANHIRKTKSAEKPSRFLYVGRLAPEKNLDFLLKTFKNLPQFSLTVVGDGPLKSSLMTQASSNITFFGHVANEILSEIYQSHDVFILPSLKEPWGLVVEEALYYGLPVLASNRVGCSLDLIEKYQVGKLFDPLQVDDLKNAIMWIYDHYEKIIPHVAQIDFKKRDEHQVKQYI